MIIAGLFALPLLLSGEPPVGAGAPKMLNPNDVFGLEAVDAIPTQVVRRGGHGVMTLDIQVSSGGRPTGCEVSEQSSEPSVDAVFCQRVLRHGRFTPAHDATGTTAAGDLHLTARWSIGPGMPVTDIVIPLVVAAVPADYRSPVKTSTTFDATGHAATCEVTASSGSAAADAGACAFVKAQIAITPPKSASPAVPPLAMRTVTVSMEADPRGAAAGK